MIQFIIQGKKTPIFHVFASYDHLKQEIRALLIEHEFSRRIAIQIKKHVKRWKNGEDAREPVARFLKTYSIYLDGSHEKRRKFL